MNCPVCGSGKPELRKLVADDSCCEYGGPTLWDRCTNEWHAADQRWHKAPHFEWKLLKTKENQ